MTQLLTPNNYPQPTAIPSSMDAGLMESFTKWSKVFQTWSPPQKKRRAIIVLDSSFESSQQESLEESSREQKLLNRRAMYIPPSVPTPTVIVDGPKDQWQKWSLYCATHHKLRRNPLPLLESIHLRKMLVTLQSDQSMPHHLQATNQRFLSQDDEEDDDIPLGALMKSNQKPLTVKIPNKIYRREDTCPSMPQYPNYLYRPNLFPLRFS